MPQIQEPVALEPRPANAHSDAAYAEHVNPQWVRLLDVLQMNERYVRCEGAELFTESGRRVLDFLSGYCVHNTGHNHPHIIAALQAELQSGGPAMLQSHVPELAGALAAELCRRADGRVNKVFFCSSGSEGVETVIKFARAHIGREGLLYCSGAFHGLTCGALSLMGDEFWKQGFGSLLGGTTAIPFNDIAALERELKTRKYAAFVVEPIQGEAGIRLPANGYLQTAQALCRRYGTLFVLDEVQTGLGRTGKFLAAHHYDVEPDMIVLAKALSGGLVPVAAVLMSDNVYDSVYDSLKRAIIHTSTYSENALAMRAGLATLEVLDCENLAANAQIMGEYLRKQLRAALEGLEMVDEIRGAGLMCGIQFRAPGSVRLRVPYEAFRRVHGGMFSQMIVRRLLREHGMLTQICGNNFMVLKAAPPLVVTQTQIDDFVAAVATVVRDVHASSAFWSDALSLARRAVNI